MAIYLERKGILFVLSAPSGGGKTTIIKKVREMMGDLAYSISVTSRPPREGETDGKDYYFVSETAFRKMVDEGMLLEWAEVHGHLYGTPKKPVTEHLDHGRDMIMDIDVQGGLAIKKMLNDSVLVFLLPPTIDTLEERLRSRNKDSEDVIALRLENAVREIAVAEKYDYCVINDDLAKTVGEIKTIIEAERTRSSRQRINFENEPALERADLQDSEKGRNG